MEGSSLLPHRYDSELIRSNSSLSRLNPVRSMSDLIDSRLGGSEERSHSLRKHESRRKHAHGKRRSAREGEESGILFFLWMWDGGVTSRWGGESGFVCCV